MAMGLIQRSKRGLYVLSSTFDKIPTRKYFFHVSNTFNWQLFADFLGKKTLSVYHLLTLYCIRTPNVSVWERSFKKKVMIGEWLFAVSHRCDWKIYRKEELLFFPGRNWPPIDGVGNWLLVQSNGVWSKEELKRWCDKLARDYLWSWVYFCWHALG